MYTYIKALSGYNSIKQDVCIETAVTYLYTVRLDEKGEDNMKIYLPTLTPQAWVSRLWVENFDLTPAHACGPISHAWLKNVSCCHLAWHNFQNYVNSDPFKERKLCAKWINDNTLLAISDFWSEKHWEQAHVYTRPKTGTGKCEGCFPLSADFGRLRKTSDFFGNLQKWSCRLQKSQHSQDRNLTLISQKKLAGIWRWVEYQQGHGLLLKRWSSQI